MRGTITAIVPTYNRAGFLAEALEALRSQTRPLDEIIVWDDGSTDATEELMQGVAAPVRYFRSENGGKSKALNAALEHAAGDYIWICDDDDIALPHAAETLAQPLDENPNLGVTGASYRRFRVDPNTGEREEQGPGYWPDLRTGSVARHLLEDIFLFQNATLARRRCYDTVGPFREDIARSIDYDMVIRLVTHFSIEMIEDTVFLQRKHEGARGPAAARHAAAQSDDVWKAADRAVFEPFRESVPLHVYQAMYDGGDADAVERAALLQRACVYARRTDWRAALEDFAEAAQIHKARVLSSVEFAICRRAVAGKHGCDEIADAFVLTKLADIARSSNAGKSIVRGLLRGLTWRLRSALRSKKRAESVRLIGVFLKLGPRVAFTSAEALEDVTERRTLPEGVLRAAS